MAVTVNIHEAKTHLSDLLNKAVNGEEVIIAKANKPLVRLVPIQGPARARLPGLNASPEFYMADDFDAPITDLETSRRGDPLAKVAAQPRAGYKVKRKTVRR